ncbi:hypothetical protein LOTGIDRAFT_238152 [Lottia gigantea]|uniref:Poly [ADP-ribose] polymerase n=1 Tax=Lottia gigantea TaxID=225164 RepID=V4CHY1_LOTGI|nr:hypothetical protein LOTGIDRAFT_238152 [Lottia gigantea]ESP01750.1 hypothetical protein LOTGIDRAFT_238152 [Lottia gigantea]
MDSDDDDRFASLPNIVDNDDDLPDIVRFHDDDDDEFDIQQPKALRESELETVQPDDDETFLQAAIIQQSNEAKYQEELNKVLTLSLLESEGRLGQNIGGNFPDFVVSAQEGIEENRSFLFHRGASSNISMLNSGPPAMEKHSTTNSSVSDRRPSLERLQTNIGHTSTGGPGMPVRRPSLERLHGANNDLFGFDEEEQARELQELIRMGIIPSNQMPSKFQKNRNRNNVNSVANVQPVARDHNFASPRMNSSRVDNSDENDNEQVLGAEGPETTSGISDLTPVAFTLDSSLENWTTNKTSPHGIIHMYELVKIPTESDEYVAIENDFRSSGLKVISVERLQNKYLLEKFKSEQDQIERSRLPGYSLNCRYLYHGTPADKDRLCEEGLDARLSRMGCFGKGIYFSDTPRKCVQYTESDQGINCILMCRVILGDTKIYPPGANDPNLRREPEKTEITHGWRYYDSVSGSPIDYNEYVVYENRRAMIEYMISYRPDYNAGSTVTSNTKGHASHSWPVTKTTKHPNGERTVQFNMTEDEHMKLIESVRDNVRQQRAKDRGETWIPPSLEQRSAERKKWQNIMQISHAEGTKVIYKTPDNNDMSINTASNITPPSETYQETDAINEVMSYLITKFLSVTNTDDVEEARRIIEDNSMDLDLSIENYYAKFA